MTTWGRGARCARYLGGGAHDALVISMFMVYIQQLEANMLTVSSGSMVHTLAKTISSVLTVVQYI